MITRRLLLASSTVAAAAYASGVHALELSPPPITESPLFTVQDKLAYVLREHGSIGIRIIKQHFSDCTPVESIIAAEDRLFADARDMHLDEISQITDPKKAQDRLDQLLTLRRDFHALPFNIVRASNRIAYESRRGFGNHALMHPDMLTTLLRRSALQGTNETWIIPEPITVGRWTKVARLSGINLWIGDVLPSDQIVAFYRSNGIAGRPEMVDGPIAVVNDGNNNLAMTTYLNKIFRFSIPHQTFV